MQYNHNHNLNSNTNNTVIKTSNLHGHNNQQYFVQHNNQQQNNNTHSNQDQLISIPTKICDGLFMADQYIAQDTQWLQMNQVTHIINCAGKHCKNNTQLTNSNNQVNFLTYQWSENNIQNILDQNVIGPSINFIQEAKKIGGSVLVHCFQSQSRPFCILAAYLMIRFQWNLFKTLEFLNSRKQDTQLQPAFFQQLTSLHQKLQEKGLIRSRNWAITDNMSDQEIILTNTFLNSRKKSAQIPNQKQINQRQSRAKPLNKNNKKVNWKNDIHVMHIYSPSTIIAQLNPKRPVNKSVEPKSRQNNLRNSRQKQRAQSVNLKGEQAAQNNFNRQNMKQNNLNSNNHTLTQISQKQKQSILNQMNVTKKWAQLRQSWMKQKQKQNNQYSMNIQNQVNIFYKSENSRKNNQQEKQIKEMNRQNNISQVQQLNTNINSSNLMKKQQKISDRIQQKLNLIKSGYEAKTNDMIKRRDHTPITGKKIKDSSSNATDRILSSSNINIKNQQNMNQQGNKKERQTFIVKKQKQNQQNSGNNNLVNQILTSTVNQSNYILSSNKSRQKQKQRPQNGSITSYDTSEDRMNQNFSVQQQSNNSNTINSTILKSSVKQLGNKSVIIVKPNGQFANFDQQQKQRLSVNSKNMDKNSDSRNSLRKVSTSANNNENINNKQNKNYLINNSNEKYQQQMQEYNNMSNQNKQNQRYSLNKQNIHPSSLNKDSKEKNSKFFRNNDKNLYEINLNNNSQKINNLNGIIKMRSSSTKPMRKEDLINSSIMKNSSYSGKGKWKF